MIEQQAERLKALAWLSESLTAIDNDDNRLALIAGAAALRAQGDVVKELEALRDWLGPFPNDDFSAEDLFDHINGYIQRRLSSLKGQG